MPTTSHGFPYPAATDTPDVPRDMKALAEKCDTATSRMRAFRGSANTDGSGNVAISWPTPFADAAYSATVTVAQNAGWYATIGAATATGITVRIWQPGGSTVNNTAVALHAIALHD